MPSFKITNERLLMFLFFLFFCLNIEDANKKVHTSSSIAGTVWDNKDIFKKKIKLQINTNQGNIFHDAI